MSFSSSMRGVLHVQPLVLAFVIVLAAFVGIAVYRLAFHPLARVPGPRIAAITGAYEAYFQLFKEGGGRYWPEVEQMHEKYGPIVRINPWEVHIKDPDWDDIYKLSSKAMKPHWYYQSFGTTLSMNSTESNELHRTRRKALLTWFSTQNIANNAPQVQAMVDRLHERLLANSGKVVNLSDAYRGLAIDVATSFAFQKAFGNMDKDDFSHEFNEAVKTYGRTGIFNRYLWGLPFGVLAALPESISSQISPAVFSFMGTVRECTNYSLNKSSKVDGDAQDMVQAILKADMPPEEKSFARVLAECRSVILAGQETTATVLSSVTFQALSNPAIADRLQKELKENQSRKGSKLVYQDLRTLPYMTAVIDEALRTCNAVSGRLTRTSAASDTVYQQYFLPRGTYLSINLNDTHMDPNLFDDPETFDPDRWLQQSKSKRNSRYLQPWGRGARICLGMELANYDLYLSIAGLFGPDRKFNMRLFDTTLEDWDAYIDFMAPLPARGAKGLRVIVEPLDQL